MGLDIYAGTLTRYYAKSWKTAVQKWAEANGMSFSRVTPNGDEVPEEKPDVDEVMQTVVEWRDSIINGVSPKDGPLYEAWPENNDASYYTDKPDWDAFGALLLYGACKKYELEVPATVAKGWDFQNHPIVKRAFEDEAMNWTLYIRAEWWIPIDDMFSFTCGSPNGHGITVGTTGSLLAELAVINELGWQASEEEILAWTKTEGYPADATVKDGQYTPVANNQASAFCARSQEYNTEPLAKFAFSMMYQAAKFSQENRVPILMDY